MVSLRVIRPSKAGSDSAVSGQSRSLILLCHTPLGVLLLLTVDPDSLEFMTIYFGGNSNTSIDKIETKSKSALVCLAGAMVLKT